MFRHRRNCKWLIVALSVSLANFANKDLAVASVKNTAAEEAVCKEIGFRPKTVSFGDCVLELLSRKEADGQKVATSPPSPSRTSGRPSRPRIEPSRPEPVVEVALTPNEQSCAGYGFKKDTVQFGQCLMQLEDARRQMEQQQRQYNLQLAEYQQQLEFYNTQKEAIKRAKRQREAEVLMRMSQGLLNSRSPSLLGGLADGFAAVNGVPVQAPTPPSPPVVQNYAIRLPNGNQVYCNFNSAASYMSCR